MNTGDGILVRAHELRKAYGRDEAPVRAVRRRRPRSRPSGGAGGDGARAAVGSRHCSTCSAGSTGRAAASRALGGRRVDQLSERALAAMRRRDVGFVFQAFFLMDELTAQENIELPALLAGHGPGEARRSARQLLEQVGLADRADHLPSAQSGGEHQPRG